MKRIITYTIFMVLMSCGFHLRGEYSLSPALHSVFLRVNDPYSIMTRELKQVLNHANIELVSSPEQASATLVIFSETDTQQLLSVGSTQQTRQYNLILTVTFELLDKHQKSILPLQAVTETRTLTLQANKILGTSNERNDLYQQMRMAIVYDIMNRLSSKQVTQIIEKSL